MDRDRFRKRTYDLRSCAKLVESLTKVPDRATEKDFRQVADLLGGAARDIDALLRADLPGCICRRFEDDCSSYLDYEKGCQHHDSLYKQQEVLKESYAKMECALKDGVRLQMIAAALSGTAVSPHDNEDLVKWAFAIADEVLDRIKRDIT